MPQWHVAWLNLAAFDRQGTGLHAASCGPWQFRGLGAWHSVIVLYVCLIHMPSYTCAQASNECAASMAVQSVRGSGA